MIELILQVLSNIKKDKLLHFLVGVLVCGIIQKFINITTGFTTVVLLGIGKELYDRNYRYHTADIWDSISTIFGGLFIVWMVI